MTEIWNKKRKKKRKREKERKKERERERERKEDLFKFCSLFKVRNKSQIDELIVCLRLLTLDQSGNDLSIISLLR